MKNKKLSFSSYSLLPLLFISGCVSTGGTISSTEEMNINLLAETCVACHGPSGVSQGPSTPSIGGLKKKYISSIMFDYQEDKVPSTVMGRIARGFTPKEIESLSKYYADLPFVPAKQPFDPEKAKKGKLLHDKYCEECHSDGGTTTSQDIERDAGILAGQWASYLIETLNDYGSTKREAIRTMRVNARKLIRKEGVEAIDLVVDYYASQQEGRK